MSKDESAKNNDHKEEDRLFFRCLVNSLLHAVANNGPSTNWTIHQRSTIATAKDFFEAAKKAEEDLCIAQEVRER